MKIFIWKDIKVSDAYHSDGGLAIIAESVESAQLLARKDKEIQDPLPAPDVSMSLHPMHRNDKEQLIVFPNAGCC